MRVKGGAGFPDASLEVGFLGGDMDFDCTSSGVACPDVAKVWEAVSIRAGKIWSVAVH